MEKTKNTEKLQFAKFVRCSKLSGHEVHRSGHLNPSNSVPSSTAQTPLCPPQRTCGPGGTTYTTKSPIHTMPCLVMQCQIGHPHSMPPVPQQARSAPSYRQNIPRLKCLWWASAWAAEGNSAYPRGFGIQDNSQRMCGKSPCESDKSWSKTSNNTEN